MNANHKKQGHKNTKQGFWVYGIRSLIGHGNRTLKGIQPGTYIYFLPFRDIEIAVSDVEREQFNEITLKKRLEDDDQWTEKSVRLHHKIIEETGKHSEAIIPMKFGTLFKSKKNIETMLQKYYKKFKNLLLYFKDKQEWGVKGYLEYEKFVKIFKNKNKEIQKLEKKRSSASEGMKWYMEKKSNELIADQVEEEIERELLRIVNALERQTEEIRLNNLLPEGVGEPGKDMIFNSACLVRNDASDGFKALFQKLSEECEPIGVTLAITGPWPPYNFVDIKNGKA